MVNVVKLQYVIMKALEKESEQIFDGIELDIDYKHSLIMSFPVSSTQRAKVEICTVERIFCERCNTEILNPSYNQTKHTKRHECYVTDEVWGEEMKLTEANS